MLAVKRNLKDGILHKEYAGRVMYCKVCGAQYSANRGDYWDTPEEYVFKCCDKPMHLGIPYSGICEINSR